MVYDYTCIANWIIRVNRTVDSRPADVRSNSKIDFACLSSTQSDNVWIRLRTVRPENAIGHRVSRCHIHVLHLDPQPLVQAGHIQSVGAGAVVRARDALHDGPDALYGRAAQPLPAAGRPAVRWHLYDANAATARQRPRTNRYVHRAWLARDYSIIWYSRLAIVILNLYRLLAIQVGVYISWFLMNINEISIS